MTLVAGPLFRIGAGFVEGFVETQDGRVVAAGEGAPPARPDVVGVILPAPVDAHTHVGDAAARGAVPRGLSLADTVAPPAGWKHRFLQETPRDVRAAGMRRALGELAAGGASAFVDFREGGLAGVRLLAEVAATPGSPRAVVLGRCVGAFDEEEAARVLAEADGLGWSGLGDAAGDAPERAAALAHTMGKRFALHVSEGRREDLARALALLPSFLVHGVFFDADDVAALAAERVPVVLCPRANAWFGTRPPARALIEAGVPVALGSDNAMFHAPSVFEEARLLVRQDAALSREAVLDAAVGGGWRLLGEPVPDLLAGRASGLVALAPRGNDPLDAVFGERPPEVVHVGGTKP